MHKKAQLSIFLIIGVILVIIFGILIAINNAFSTREAIDLPFESAAIQTYITACLQQTAEHGLIILGKQGGYFDPKSYIESPSYKITYLYDNGQNNVPTDEQVEEQLSEYIDQNMLSCLNDFDDLDNLGWRVTHEQPQTSTQLNQRDVTFTQSFPINIQKGEESLSFSAFTNTADVRLRYALEITREIIAFHQEQPEWTDLTRLSAHDLNVFIFPYQKKLMYSLDDNQSQIRGNSYQFNFALQFD